MLGNYFKTAFRNLLKYRFISTINLFGLAIGLTCCLLILAYILNEMSYDRFNRKADQIYRVTRIFNAPDGNESLHLGSVAPPFGPLLQHDFPDITGMTRLLDIGTTALRYKDKLFNEQGLYFADEHFFDFFSVPVLKGNPKSALEEPYCVMMTEDLAKKYFGNEDPMNKVISLNNIRSKASFKVTGIFQAFPPNSHLHPEMLISFNTLKDSSIYGEQALLTNWGNNAFFTYLMFPKNYPVKKIEAQFPAFIDRHLHYDNLPANTRTSRFTSLSLQKLTDIHLRSHLDSEIEENGDISRVYIFAAIALFILLIACINYMNLSTARSLLRAREIGVRKAIGAQRREIILQFLSESVIITCLAMLLAFLLTRLLLPYLNQLSARQITMHVLLRPQVLIPLLLMPFAVGLLSGIYPAIFLSSFRPVQVLKGIIRTGGGNISFRKALVITQFSISIVLIIATMVVFQQLRFMQNKSLGFNKDHIITLSYPGALDSRYNAFRTELLQNSHFKALARSSRIPTGRLLDDQGAYTLAGSGMQPSRVDIKYVVTDYDFIPTFGISMAAGRNFSRDYGNDSTSFILNDAAVKALSWGLPRDAIGKDFKYANVQGKIIGVVHDFNFESLHQKIVPMVFVFPGSDQSGYGHLSIKIGGSDIPATLSYLKRTWYRFLPETPFDYTFLDERFAKLYQSEQREGTIFTIFACIAIFIACLGLFGLSSFMITQRIKEIGIRKVLGAGITDIVGMLSKDFLKLVGIAALIAFPLAWLGMNKWLNGFAYRIHIQGWVLIIAAVSAALIAFITISFQAVKAAVANPVEALRSE